MNLIGEPFPWGEQIAARGQGWVVTLNMPELVRWNRLDTEKDGSFLYDGLAVQVLYQAHQVTPSHQSRCGVTVQISDISVPRFSNGVFLIHS